MTQRDLDELAAAGINLDLLYRKAGLNPATMRSKRRSVRQVDPTAHDSAQMAEALAQVRRTITGILRRHRASQRRAAAAFSEGFILEEGARSFD